jgi:hypothetical protein
MSISAAKAKWQRRESGANGIKIMAKMMASAMSAKISISHQLEITENLNKKASSTMKMAKINKEENIGDVARQRARKPCASRHRRSVCFARREIMKLAILSKKWHRKRNIGISVSIIVSA